MILWTKRINSIDLDKKTVEKRDEYEEEEDFHGRQTTKIVRSEEVFIFFLLFIEIISWLLKGSPFDVN